MVRQLNKTYRLLFKKRNRLPDTFWFEVTNKCNLSCGMCPRIKEKIPQEDMKLSLFNDILKKIRHPRQIILTGWGEPLAHKDFFEMASLARERFPKAGLMFTTNGHLFTEENISKIIRSGITAVNVSIDGIPEKDGSVWLGHPYSPIVTEGIEKLIRQRRRQALPVIRAQAVMIKNALGGLLNLISVIGKIGVDEIALIRFNKFSADSSAQRPDFQEEAHILNAAAAAAKKAGLKFTSLNRKNIMVKLLTHFDRHCPWTDNIMYINTSLYATPCCNLRDLRMGDLTKDSIEGVWRGRDFLNFFENQHVYCSKCDSLKFKHSNQ